MVRQDDLSSVCQNQVMGLCSVMVPVGSIFGGGALILLKSVVNRVGRGPVVCIGRLCTSSPSTLLVPMSKALSITTHHCCSLISLCPTPQCQDSRSKYLSDHSSMQLTQRTYLHRRPYLFHLRTVASLICLPRLPSLPPPSISTWRYSGKSFDGAQVTVQSLQSISRAKMYQYFTSEVHPLFADTYFPPCNRIEVLVLISLLLGTGDACLNTQANKQIRKY